MRIEKGTFGVCRDCGEPIAEARLNAIPWTRVCITCKEKQKAVSDPTLAELIRDFYLERVSLLMRHEDVGAARHRLRHQQRLPVHHRPRGDAPVVAAARAARPAARRSSTTRPRTALAAPGKGDAWKSLAADDARANAQFVEKWRPKVEIVTNARHKGMLKVILGEMLEHKRLFDQAARRQHEPDRHVARRSTTTAASSCRPAGWNSGERRGAFRAPVAIALGRTSAIAKPTSPSAVGTARLHHQPLRNPAGTTPLRSACPRCQPPLPERRGRGRDRRSRRASCSTALLAIEAQARPAASASPMAPRTLDLDLILFGDERIERTGTGGASSDDSASGSSCSSRSRRWRRDWIDPVTGQTVSALLQQRGARGPS